MYCAMRLCDSLRRDEEGLASPDFHIHTTISDGGLDLRSLVDFYGAEGVRRYIRNRSSS